ncbi:MAG: DUF2314 domain-containing protein [Pseudomonadota bacterium]
MRTLFFTAPIALLLASAATPQAPTPTAQAQQVPGDRNDVASVDTEDPEMNRAIADAKRALPDFLEVLENPPQGASRVGFKFPLGGWEHIWVGDVRRDGTFLTGRLNNVPIQKEFSEGDAVRVPLSEVSDWAWMDTDGEMRGQFTTRVLLDRLDPAIANAIRQNFGWDK